MYRISFIKNTFFFLAIILCGFFWSVQVDAQTVNHPYPRTMNYFLKWHLSDAEATQLAKWDVLVLDMETQVTSAPQLKKIRSLNPDVIMLAYITSQEIRTDAAMSQSLMRKKLASGIESAWYLVNTSGKTYSNWPGTAMLNPSSMSPKVNGKKYTDYLASFVAKEIIATGLWDGVFYDNAWQDVTWMSGPLIDLNRDGAPDGAQADVLWRTGMTELFAQTRLLAPDTIVVGNSHLGGYVNDLNGKLIETFQAKTWHEIMNVYAANHKGVHAPRINMINSNTENTGNKTNYKQVRFGLGSTLLGDGYFSFDYGDKEHAQLWWYDEYDVDLGTSLSGAKSINKHSVYTPDIWRRDFSNGMALVNSTNKPALIDLGGDFEKIHGVQDPKINDGAIVSETVIDGYDGLILLKTLATLNDVLYTNGGFVRFFREEGERVRNGFFVFEEGYKGGEQIAHIDLDGNGKRDLLVVDRNKVVAWRDDGLPYMKVYPYTAEYKGELRVAIGDMRGDGTRDIVVAPSAGFALPIKLYNRYGREVRSPIFPFGQKYAGGYFVTFANMTGPNLKGKIQEWLLVGGGQGMEPKVQLYSSSFIDNGQWSVFEPQFKGGVRLSAGDVNGDGIDEILVGAGPGKKPIIRVFSSKGTLLSEFTAYETSGTPGIDVRAVDVDFDGKEDIIGLSSGI